MSEAGQQLGLDLWAREHDLPPRWDGLLVEWGDWDDIGRMFICPPPKRPHREHSRRSCSGRHSAQYRLN